MEHNDLAQALLDKFGTQQLAAKAVGVSQPTFRAWTRGGEISRENLERLRSAYLAAGSPATQRPVRQKPTLTVVRSEIEPSSERRNRIAEAFAVALIGKLDVGPEALARHAVLYADELIKALDSPAE